MIGIGMDFIYIIYYNDRAEQNGSNSSSCHDTPKFFNYQASRTVIENDRRLVSSRSSLFKLTDLKFDGMSNGDFPTHTQKLPSP